MSVVVCNLGIPVRSPSPASYSLTAERDVEDCQQFLAQKFQVIPYDWVEIMSHALKQKSL